MKRVKTVELRLRKRKPFTPEAYMTIMPGLRARVLGVVGGMILVEVDRERAQKALARNDAYVRERWHSKSEEWRARWCCQVQRWERVLR